MGIAPLYLTAKKLKELNPDTIVDIYLGFSDEALLVDLYEKVADKVTVNIGGFVTDDIDPLKYDCIMTCGPEIMMKVLCKKCKSLGVQAPVYVSMETVWPVELEHVWCVLARLPPVIRERAKMVRSCWEVRCLEMSKRLEVNYAGVHFKNPVALASGTCGFGKEMSEYFDIQRLGGLCSKGLTLHPRGGNDGIRVWETPSGVMNSVGLENPGVKHFIECDAKRMNALDLVNIVNLGGHSMEDYLEAVELLNGCELDLLELNISCPNVKAGGMNFGVKTELARQVVREIRKVCKHKLVIKLSPNAEDIVALARACEEEGADGVSLTNTFLAMAIDIKRGKPVFDNVYAGLSGPAIKPIALRMVHQVAHAVKIPVMGIGGIATWQDAIEFIMAGATTLQVGAASFMNPSISMEIIDGMEDYLEKNRISNISEIRGIL